MCKEYAKKIKKTSQFGSLSLDPSAQNISLAGCNWVTGLIVGGVNANTGEFPHMAAIGYPNLDKKIAFLCGGSLISDQFVLTAAHCKRADRVAPTTVRLGGLNLASKFKAVKEVDIPIATFIPHEAYDSETKQNDIGLIRMRFPVTFSSEVRPACLWQKANINEPRAIASGWGYQKYQGSSSDELKKVQLDIYSNSECTNSYSDEDFIINQNQVCAGFLPGGRDTCQGGEIQKVSMVYHFVYSTFIQQIQVVHFRFSCPKTNACTAYSASHLLDRWSAVIKTHHPSTLASQHILIGLRQKFGRRSDTFSRIIELKLFLLVDSLSTCIIRTSQLLFAGFVNLNNIMQIN